DQVLAVAFPTLTQATAAAAALRTAPLLPSALLLLHADVAVAWATALPLTVQAPQVVLLLNYDGIREAVARQIRDSRTLRPTPGSLADPVLSGTGLATLWELYESWCRTPAVMAQPFSATASAGGGAQRVAACSAGATASVQGAALSSRHQLNGA